MADIFFYIGINTECSRQVFIHRLKIASDSCSSFHHLGVKTDKNLEACLPCTLSDGGTCRAVMENQREHGAARGVISA